MVAGTIADQRHPRTDNHHRIRIAAGHDGGSGHHHLSDHVGAPDRPAEGAAQAGLAVCLHAICDLPEDDSYRHAHACQPGAPRRAGYRACCGTPQRLAQRDAGQAGLRGAARVGGRWPAVAGVAARRHRHQHGIGQHYRERPGPARCRTWPAAGRWRGMDLGYRARPGNRPADAARAHATDAWHSRSTAVDPGYQRGHREVARSAHARVHHIRPVCQRHAVFHHQQHWCIHLAPRSQQDHLVQRHQSLAAEG